MSAKLEIGGLGRTRGAFADGRTVVADGAKTAKSMQLQKRQQRLAAELRANLGKRKAQARARAADHGNTGREDRDRRGDA
jgi:hypothetical protein